jgi:DNA-binding IclR family transcriptional regulator
VVGVAQCTLVPIAERSPTAADAGDSRGVSSQVHGGGGAELPGTQALDRGLAVLGAVASARSSMSVAEIARAVDLPESTTYRVVQALRRSGLLSRAGQSTIKLGPAVFSLARAAQRQVADDIPVVALPFMMQLVETTGETAILTIPHGTDVVCVETVEGPQPLHVSFPRFSVTPLFAGSAVAALAHQDARLISLVLAMAHGRRYADGRAVTEAHLRGQIESVRERGFAISRGEVDAHATSVGVPVFEGPGRCVAAMSVAAPTERVTGVVLDSLVLAVTSAGAAVSRCLGEHVVLRPPVDGPAELSP